MNQPACSRIIRFVFPLPVAPTMTMCRLHAASGTAKTERQRCPMVRMVPPTGIRSPRASSGTAPGALFTSIARPAWCFHCLASNVIGADASLPPIPLIIA